MPIIETSDLTPRSVALMHEMERHQIYNGLDCAVTSEVFDVLHRQTNGNFPPIYNFAMKLQGPMMDMMLRGWAINESERQLAIRELERKSDRLYSILDQFAHAIWDRGLNPRSTQQLQAFFYDHMQLTKEWTSKKGVKSLSMDRETLEKLHKHILARPFLNTILAIRDVQKELEVFKTQIGPDGRFHFSLNIAGTETGRLSSSSDAFGNGRNIQNIDRKLRRMFVADKGKKLCGIDLEQAESREVGWQSGILFDDWTYLDACYAGDLHTITCRMIWPNLQWTGDLVTDKAIAETKFYREFTYRDFSKRGGHGSNYYGTPFTMARHLKVPTQFMVDFQNNYFSAFPGIQQFHRYIAQTIQRTNELTTPWGRKREFFGRTSDDTTLREAIAYIPQSSTADRMNTGLYEVWKQMPEVQLLAQVHDAIYFQYDEDADEAAIVARALNLIDIRLKHKNRELIVPGEAKVGWNWGDYNDDPKRGRLNLDGLKKFKIADNRIRHTGLQTML